MNAFDHKAWDAAGFKDFEDYADCIEYVNQSWYGCDQLEGEWWYPDNEALVIYSGSFGNDNSPGAASYTYAEQYDTREEFDEAVKEWENKPEYLETEDDETGELDEIAVSQAVTTAAEMVKARKVDMWGFYQAGDWDAETEDELAEEVVLAWEEQAQQREQEKAERE